MADETPEPLSDGEQIQFANMLNALKGPLRIKCVYKNWRGEQSERKIELKDFWFGSTEYHQEPCLLLRGTDLDKMALRDFKVADFLTETIEVI